MAVPFEPFLVEPDGIVADSLFLRLHPHVKVLSVRRKQLQRYNLNLPVRAKNGCPVALIRTREQFCQVVEKCKFPGGYDVKPIARAAFLAGSEPTLLLLDALKGKEALAETNCVSLNTPSCSISIFWQSLLHTQLLREVHLLQLQTYVPLLVLQLPVPHKVINPVQTVYFDVYAHSCLWLPSDAIVPF
jgi:hypothetical protein